MIAGEARSPSATTEDWQRLHPRSVAISLTWLVPPIASTLLTLVLTGGDLDPAAMITLGSVGLTFLIVAVVFAVRLATTRYRVTKDQVELRSGAFLRRHRTVPRDRIRTVDVTASPFHRVLGLRAVRIGTGDHASADGRHLTLDGVSLERAEELRRLAGDPTGAQTALAVLTWRWLRYAPLTLWGVAGVGAVLGAFSRLLDSLQISPADVGFLRATWFALADLPLWAATTVPVVAVVALGAVASVAAFIEAWWDYRLDEAGEGALRLRRGLFSTRSLWLERRRLRGVQIIEPLLLRLARGARLDAIATGLGDADDQPASTTSALLPPASRRDAARVAMAVLGERPELLEGLELTGAPRVALRRRATWALLATAVVVAPLLLFGVLLTGVLLRVAWVSALLLAPAGLAVALDAYRNLGYGLLGRYVVTRCGSYERRTVLIDRRGILGWRIDQSAAQRRAGLATLVALVPAGRGGYKIRDVALADGVAFIRRATPGMLEPFLETAVGNDPLPTRSVPTP